MRLTSSRDKDQFWLAIAFAGRCRFPELFPVGGLLNL
jgi:hypothetical protein